MNDLILQKESSESEIRAYFEAVLELSKSDNEFPINLDDVWQLVYANRSDATKVLRENYVQGVDYQLLRQNPEKVGHRKKDVYRLSLPCMEFFIARKVRPVFEVYRRVFHGVARMSLTSTEDMIANPDLVIRLATAVKEERAEKERLRLESARQDEVIRIQTEELEKAAPKAEAYDRYVTSDGLLTITQIAKEYGYGGVTLNEKLRRMGVQYKQNGQWLLTEKYQNKGYTQNRPIAVNTYHGPETKMMTMWTMKGREFIHSLIDDITPNEVLADTAMALHEETGQMRELLKESQKERETQNKHFETAISLLEKRLGAETKE